MTPVPVQYFNEDSQQIIQAQYHQKLYIKGCKGNFTALEYYNHKDEVVFFPHLIPIYFKNKKNDIYIYIKQTIFQSYLLC